MGFDSVGTFEFLGEVKILRIGIVRCFNFPR